MGDLLSGDDQVAQLRDWVEHAARVVVLTGAGISTGSGIPDFRGPNGVWTKNPLAEKASSIEHYLGNPEVRRAAWENRLHSPAWDAQPNAGHRAIVGLQDAGRLVAVVTQNVDGLHQKAGIDPDKVIEVHGTMWWTRCWECSDRRPMAEAIERVGGGEPDPSCLVCGGILKSDTISFGQALVPEVIEAAMQVAEHCDLLIAAGSTLSVYPAANVVPRARATGARIVIMNAEPTQMDRFADILVRGDLSELLPAVLLPAGQA